VPQEQKGGGSRVTTGGYWVEQRDLTLMIRAFLEWQRGDSASPLCIFRGCAGGSCGKLGGEKKARRRGYCLAKNINFGDLGNQQNPLRQKGENRTARRANPEPGEDGKAAKRKGTP